MSGRATRFGPLVGADGTLFRLWAPDAEACELRVRGEAPWAMTKDTEGFFEVLAPGVGPGAAYRFHVAGRDVPDPASRGQEDEVEGWSLVQAALEPPRVGPKLPWTEAVIVEVHVGAATPEGTYLALIDRLDHYRDSGFTVIELMPVADCPGRWNWGYDGVLLFAPNRAYGTPRELRALIEAAHERGLKVMLDVVYNHFGPSGNYLPLYAQSFFREDIQTPWGAAIDLENPIVRAFFLENARYWLHDLGFDGLRLDAVHALATSGAETFLRELAASCREGKADAFLVLENHDNVAGWMTKAEALYTAQWNDDWHHVFHVLASGETHGYYATYATDPIGRAARALTEGFVFQGEPYPAADGRPRGTPSLELPPDAFVHFLQNHDHIGNRALGDRLTSLETIAPERLALLRFVLMLSPHIPLLFMGEEVLSKTPFPFFCDFSGELADAVRSGRRREFAAFFQGHDGGSFPDPLDAQTFASAQLRAEHFHTPEARAAGEAFRDLALARRSLVWPLTATSYHRAECTRTGDALLLAWFFEGGTLTMALNPTAEEVRLVAGAARTPPRARIGKVEGNEQDLVLGPFAAALWSPAP
jgi:maltooligosyltrehalose trehalohydrolase